MDRFSFASTELCVKVRAIPIVIIVVISAQASGTIGAHKPNLHITCNK